MRRGIPLGGSPLGVGESRDYELVFTCTYPGAADVEFVVGAYHHGLDRVYSNDDGSTQTQVEWVSERAGTS